MCKYSNPTKFFDGLPIVPNADWEAPDPDPDPDACGSAGA